MVSVGNSNTGGGEATTRRIVNVADGAATSDAATVGQLQKAQTEVASLIGGGVTVQGNGSFSGFTVQDKDKNEYTFNTVAEGFALLANGTINLLPSDAVTFVSATDKRITGVADGIDNSDVVNVGQLNQALADNKVQYFHVNSSEPSNQGSNGAAGINAMAIGPAAIAGGASSIAFGHDVNTSAAKSIAIGNDVDAIGVESTVIGNSGTMAIHEAGVAIGKNAHSYGINSIVIGTGARSHLANSDEPNHNTVVIGTSAEATADNGTAIGMDAVATDERAVALGTTAQARGEDSMAFGSNAIATGVSSQASGTNANASGLNAQASGTGASASGYNAVATGTEAVGYATDGIAMGTGAVSGFSDPFNTDAERNTAGIAIGNQSLADQEHALALGVAANARAKSSAAIGDGAKATAAAENGLAIGKEATVSAKDATAIGTGAEATAKAIDGVAIGTDARVDGESALAFGDGASATKSNALAFGTGASATGVNSSAIGFGANAQKDNSMALGTGAIAYHEGSVALGSGSVTGTANVERTPEAEIDGVPYYFAGAKDGVVSTVSVGAPGEERTISNVAAGRLNADSTDAINGSQLHATNTAVTALGNNLDTFGGSVAKGLGGGSSYNPETHTVDTVLNVNGNTYYNVNDAIQYAAKGWDLSGSDDNEVNIGPEGKVDFQGDNNISVAQTGVEDAGVIAIKLAKDVNLGADGSLQTGNTLVNDAGVTVGDGKFAPTTTVGAGNIVVGGPGGLGANSIVLNADIDGADITGLTNQTVGYVGFADGSGRAATEEQLKLVSDVAENANQGWNVTTNADPDSSENVAPGATVDFDNTDDNIVISQSGTDLVFNLSDTLSIGGKDGKDGSIGVKGADGENGISITPDAIVFHGIDGVDGKDGSMTMGTGAAGVDGKDGITRIQYTDPDGRDFEVATLDDGLNFKGDGNEIISLNLNEQLNLTGGAAEADLADRGNIGVVEDGAGGLSIQLAKDIDLGEEGSLTTGDTVVDTDGLRITGASDNDPSTKVEAGRIELFANPTDTSANTIVIDAETGDITGLSNINLESPDFGTVGRAATEEQLQTFGDELTAAGLNFVGNNATQKVHKDLGETLSIVGGLADTENASNANIRVDAVLIGFDDDSNPIYDGLDIKLATKLTDLEDIQVGKDGKDGVDGTIGVHGKDGASVVLNGKDGSIGLTGPSGEDGAPGASADLSVIDGTRGIDGNDGADGKTRIVYEKPNGEVEEVATLNDGLYFQGDQAGDDGNVARKLNETLNLTGGATDVVNEANIGVIKMADGEGYDIRLAQDIRGLNTLQVGGNTGPILGGNTDGSLVLNPEGPAAKITNVADGIIADGSKDAINGSQLWALGDSLKKVFGENAAFDPDTGGLTITPYEINGGEYKSVFEAIEKLAAGWDINVESGAPGESGGEGSAPGAGTGTGTGGPASILPGDQLTLVAGDNIIIEQQPKEDGNVNIDISVNPNLVVDSVTAGQTVMDNSGVKVGDNVHLGDTGLTIVGGPTGDLAFTAGKVDVGGNKIQNVANGIIADGSKDAINGGQIKDISQSVADAFGGGSTVNEDGTVSAPSYTVGNADTVVNNVGDALDILNQGWTLTAEGNDTQVQAGDKVSLVNDDKNIVITHAADSGIVAFNLSDNIQIGETITIGGDTDNQTVINKGGITTNTVNATSVTTNNFNAGGGTMVVNEGSVAIAENTHINMGGNRITNVAPGVDGTDAVNMNQLGTVANSLSRDIRRVDREARAGTASAAAMANLPQAYLPGKSMFAVAGAGHRGESGYAAGLSTVSDNGKWVIKGSVAGNSRGDVTYGAGVGYQW